MGLLALITLGFVAVAVHMYRSNVRPPASVTSWIKSALEKKTGLAVDFSDLQVKLQGNRIETNNVVLGASGTTPFLKLDSLNVELSSGTSLRTLMRGDGLVENINLVGAEIDLLALGKMRGSTLFSATEPASLAAYPIKSFSADRVQIVTPIGTVTVPAFRMELKRVAGVAETWLNITANPLEGVASIAVRLALDTPKMRVEIAWRDLSLAKSLEFCETLLPFSYARNLVEKVISLTGRVDLDLTWEGDPFKRAADPMGDLFGAFKKELSGTMAVRDGVLAFGSDVQSFSVSLKKPSEEFCDVDLRVAPATGTLGLACHWKPTAENGPGVIEGRFSAEQLSIPPSWPLIAGRVEPRLGLGSVDGSGTVVWDGRNLRTDGIASFAQWQWDGRMLPPAGLAWRQVGDRIEASGTLSFERGCVTGLAAINLAGPEQGVFEATGHLSGVGLEFLQKLFKIPLNGLGNGEFTVSGQVDKLDKVEYDLNLDISEPHLFGIDAKSLTGRIYGTGSDWNVGDPLAVFADGGFLKVEGQITSSSYECSVKGERLSPRRFGASSEQASGTFSFTGDLSGALDDPHLEGEVWSNPLSIMGLPLESLRAHLSLVGERFELQPLVMRLLDGATADGFLALDIRNGSLQGFQVDVANLELSSPALQKIPGLAKLHPHGKISGTIQHSSLEGKAAGSGLWEATVMGSSLNIASETLNHLRFEAASIGDHFEIRAMDLVAFGGEIELRGRGGFSPWSFSCEGTARDLTLSRIRAVKRIFPEIKGSITGEGNLEWLPNGRSGSLTLFGTGLAVGDHELGNLGADLALDDSGVTIRRAAVDKMGIEATGQVKWSGDHPYRASLKMMGTDLSFVPAAFGLKGFGRGDLMVDGACELRGNLATSTPDFLKASVGSMEIRRGGDVVVANHPVDLVFQNGRLEIRSFELKYRQGVFGVQGMLDPAGLIALTLVGHDFSLKALGSLAEIPGWDVDGSLSIKGGVTGSVSNPGLAADIQVRRMILAGREIPQVDASIKVNRREISVAPMVLSLTQNKVTFEGKLPFREGWQMGDLDLCVKVPRGPLDDLPKLLPEYFKTAHGEMHGEMRFFGNPFQPSIAGDFELKAVELAFPGMRSPLKDVALGMKTENKIVRIAPLSAKLGRGLISGGGEIDFRDGPGSMSLSLSGDKIDVAWGRIDLENNHFDLTATGNVYNPVVRGKVLLPKGRIQLADNLLDGFKFNHKLPFQTLDFRLDFEIPRNIWVRNSMLNAEMRGKFGVNGNLKGVHVTGSVQTVQGALYFQRRKFNIENGEVKFGEREGQFDPHVFFKSVTTIQTTQVYMTLEGNLSSLKPRLYSSPPLAEGDIFALITLGRNIDQNEFGGSRGQLERDILENLKNTYLTGLLSSTLGTALNLDELYMGSLFDRTSGTSRSFLRIGKYLGHNIFFAYEGTLSNEDKKTYIFEYRLPRGFLFNLESEKPTNEMRVGVKYDWKF
ncbi:MAG: translocation/assembly module TamB domain-containing protein [Candidatus Riflebacteria bacterium]|nr:translocation/assembly module TamB domain-containing protein [Candidatus Riflebacteria bacterium]